MMLFLWILSAIAIIVVLRYTYLIIKRFLLIRKISKKMKKHNGNIQYYRSPLTSVFKHDGKADLSLSFQGKTIDVSVITTPFRRVRYHFDINNMLLELIIERRAVCVGGPRAPRPTHISAIDNAYPIRKYKMGFEVQNIETQKYVILHPAPLSISKAEGAAQIGRAHV